MSFETRCAFQIDRSTNAVLLYFVSIPMRTTGRCEQAHRSDLIDNSIAWMECGDVAQHDLGFQLNDILLSALAASKSDRYGKPNEAFKLLANLYQPSVV
jgi:hypothetical protein